MTDPTKGSPQESSTWEARIQKDLIVFSELVILKHWQTNGTPEQQGLFKKHYEAALDSFKNAHGGKGAAANYGMEISIFGECGCGARLHPDGELRYTVMESAIGFDWSEAHRLLHRVDRTARRSRDIWRIDPPDKADGDAEAKKPSRRERAIVAERRRHGSLGYDLLTSLFSAINLETKRKKGASNTKPSKEFSDRITLIEPQVADAEHEFDIAAQRQAQVRYAYGMVIGIAILALVSIMLAIIFDAHNVPAYYGVATVAGGVGAVVSVLQRMASGRLKLDFNAGTGMLMTLGAVRPVIGAVFGTVLFAVFDGNWLPAIEISKTKPLAFYTVLGFLSGFNERFAQDMLVGSARQLSGQLPAGETPPQQP